MGVKEWESAKDVIRKKLEQLARAVRGIPRGFLETAWRGRMGLSGTGYRPFEAQGKQKPCPNRRSVLYYLFTICQAINKSFGYWRLERKKFSLGSSICVGVLSCLYCVRSESQRLRRGLWMRTQGRLQPPSVAPPSPLKPEGAPPARERGKLRVQRREWRGERFWGAQEEQESGKIKVPTRETRVGAPKFVLGLIVRATRPSVV